MNLLANSWEEAAAELDVGKGFWLACWLYVLAYVMLVCSTWIAL